MNMGIALAMQALEYQKKDDQLKKGQINRETVPRPSQKGRKSEDPTTRTPKHPVLPPIGTLASPQECMLNSEDLHCPASATIPITFPGGMTSPAISL
jgi:hypothetical protein